MHCIGWRHDASQMEMLIKTVWYLPKRWDEKVMYALADQADWTRRVWGSLWHKNTPISQKIVSANGGVLPFCHESGALLLPHRYIFICKMKMHTFALWLQSVLGQMSHHWRCSMSHPYSSWWGDVFFCNSSVSLQLLVNRHLPGHNCRSLSALNWNSFGVAAIVNATSSTWTKLGRSAPLLPRGWGAMRVLDARWPWSLAVVNTEKLGGRYFRMLWRKGPFRLLKGCFWLWW